MIRSIRKMGISPSRGCKALFSSGLQDNVSSLSHTKGLLAQDSIFPYSEPGGRVIWDRDKHRKSIGLVILMSL